MAAVVSHIGCPFMQRANAISYQTQSAERSKEKNKISVSSDPCAAAM